ncbi:unnamed protein product [Moneuplotes crassus]|uniref:Uncharacterized protein n=1 Tax=Euplotes crassus TaxID=5936 RepID=A0AAD1XL05_EUPCR|nr:unnamed protein product [Moneuplotes crassus]
MSIGSVSAASKIKGLLTKRGSCYEILVFCGAIDEWRRLMRLLCRETKQYYEEKKNEFKNLCAFKYGNSWKVIRLIRKYITNKATKANMFDFILQPDSEKCSSLCDRIVDNDLSIPNFRSLFLKASKDMTKIPVKSKSFENIKRFVDHLLVKYAESKESNSPQVPFKTLILDGRLFKIALVSHIVDKLLMITEAKVDIIIKSDLHFDELSEIFLKICKFKEIVFINMIPQIKAILPFCQKIIQNKLEHIYLKESCIYYYTRRGDELSLKKFSNSVTDFFYYLKISKIHLTLKSVTLSLTDSTGNFSLYPLKFKQRLSQLPNYFRNHLRSLDLKFRFKFISKVAKITGKVNFCFFR